MYRSTVTMWTMHGQSDESLLCLEAVSSPRHVVALLLCHCVTVWVQDSFIMGKELGRGQYGVIRLCTDKQSGDTFACKSINKQKLTGVREVEDVQREIKVMEMLKGHPAVIDLKATFEDQKVRHRPAVLSCVWYARY